MDAWSLDEGAAPCQLIALALDLAQLKVAACAGRFGTRRWECRIMSATAIVRIADGAVARRL
jgi:hypothetical protein